MRIKKLLISNFKNVSDTIIINFEKDITLLVGPNGFGKTTIFDAIELALTGMIYRISNTKVTDGRSSFKKTYFQNDTNKDVVIKLLLCNDKNEYLTIVRWYKKNSTSNGKDLYPAKSLEQFQLLIDDESNFSDISNVSTLKPGRQGTINQFIGFHNESYKVQDIYNLFNYIQQEDTDYYLRKNEQNRKETLNFLLQIQNYQDKKQRIHSLKENFDKTKKNLINQEKAYEQQHIFDIVEYEELPLTQKKEHKLNNKEIDFELEVSDTALKVYMDEIDKLIRFRENFSPDEYFKKQQRNKFQKEILDNEELLNYILFRGFLNDSESSKRIIDNQESLMNQANYSYYLLENFVDKIEFLENQIVIKNNLDKFKQNIRLDLNKIDIEKTSELFNRFESSDLMREQFKLFKNNFDSFCSKNQELSSSKDDYSELNALRDKLKDHFLPNDMEHRQCTLCGYDWHDNEKLQKQYNMIARFIDNSLSVLQKEVSDLSLNLGENAKELIDSISELEDKLIIVEAELIDELKLVKKSESFSNFEQLLESTISIEPFEFGVIDFKLYQQTKEELKEALKKEMLIPSELYTHFDFSKKNKEDFEAILTKYSTISDKLLMDNQLSSQMLPLSIKKFNLNVENLKNELINISMSISYNSIKSNDPTNLFDEYFDSQKALFNECIEEKLITKKKYIDYKFREQRSIKLKEIRNRLSVVTTVHSYLEDRVKKLNENIKIYQQQMIDILKLPFFLYTAKILQNYQQGMGVLLTSHEQNSNIRFLTSSDSQQDAMYQLSSGQIAVISFAFTLSLNKTFNISEGLRFLAIDDPIQDMDAMNVHALIDLLRHSLPDYQIIMSTHSDSSAMFIKYKFDLMSDKKEGKVNLINAKTLFLES